MLKRMRIGTMLTFGFGVVILLMTLMVAITHLRVTDFATSIGEIHHNIYPNTSAAASIRFNVVKNWSNTLMLGTIGNKEVIKRINEEMASSNKIIGESFNVLKQEFNTDEGSKLVAAALAANEDFNSKRKEYMAMLAEDDKDPANFFLVGPLKSSLEDYLGSINKIFAAMTARLDAETARSLEAASQTRAINLIIGFIALLAAMGSAVLMVCTVSKQLGGEVFEAGNIAREISEGNLSVNISVRSGDSSSLLASLKSMRDRLRSMAGEIQGSARQVTETAHKVSQAAAEVAQASTSQSDASGFAAAAVEELTVSIGHLSHNAEDAHTFSQQASELSQNGEAVIRSAGMEMEKIARSVQSSSAIIAELEQRSNEISTVVNVIKEIADQTNLLALNAAIEAARAGEQGRGFAVVADEVRKLAERTSKSTQEIALTVGKIQQGTLAAVHSMVSGVEQVQFGSRMAEQAGQSIGEIQSGSAQVVAAVNDISSALKEQSAASNDIARSIEQIAQRVTANKTASEKVAAAAIEMGNLADGLSASVRFFRL
ncbi:MAG: methyl-accepting chemotaxis protein [Propionivibrio sp.]|uniref:methyl-accepting chemotaxis protein n=1 Tax=Propionivibrio sp. TaxID=2212460 RepID=UPI001A642882|nr:methyl-accepting chemotaxis protein [Propionivibrio sp.]MBL8415225.1 methyl-accepting chemotaxis protein [Propionivibrio sp.]